MIQTHHNSTLLDNQMLQRMAPSIFAPQASTRCSQKYQFFPTSHIVEALRGEGWFPVHAKESRSKAVDRIGFQKHVIRFRRDTDSMIQLNEAIPELVLMNSHDGASAYQLHAGVFRLVCLNGMVVSDGLIGKISVRHQGFKSSDVIEASYRILEGIPEVMHSVQSMTETQLTRDEQHVFAEAALTVRYDDEPSPISSDQLLSPRRMEDRGGSLWQTLNVVQENLIRGGLEGHARKSEKPRKIVTRPIQSIDRDLILNKALWKLAEKMKDLKLSA